MVARLLTATVVLTVCVRWRDVAARVAALVCERRTLAAVFPRCASSTINQHVYSQDRFPFKRNRLRCVRCENENRKKRKRLRWQAANHGCHCFDRAFLLAGACQPSLPSPPLRSRPHIAAMGSGEAFKFPRRVRAQSGRAKRFLVNFRLKIVHLVHLKELFRKCHYMIGHNKFYPYDEGAYAPMSPPWLRH